MQTFTKLITRSALLVTFASVSSGALAQDYVDMETERATAAQPGPADPYAPRGTEEYPTTSFGVGTAPAGTPVGPTSTTGTGAVPGAQGMTGQNLGALFVQIQQLQQQVMMLNGKVEEQANELRMLREQSMQRYVDLDKRLVAVTAGGAAVAGQAPATGTTGPVTPAPAPTTGTAPVAAQQGEAEAYRAAYSLVQNQQFDQAVQAFRQFQRDYPDGKFAPNAYYWLGELYLVVDPADLESSRQSFTMLLTQYPDNNKVPDALYKLGKVQFMKGNPERAKEYLDQVIAEYGSTNSSAVKLAREFLAANY